MTLLTTKILDVRGVKATTKFGEKDLYWIELSDNNSYSTFKEPLASGAKQAQGIEGVTVEVEENDGFLNFLGVKEVPEGTIVPDEVEIEVGGVVSDSNEPTKKDRYIARQTAWKATTALLSGSGATFEEALPVQRLIEADMLFEDTEMPVITGHGPDEWAG